MFCVDYLISVTHLCFIAFLSLYIVLIDVLIYSAAQLQECLINLLTYLLNSLSTKISIQYSSSEYLLWKLNQTQPTKIYLDVSVSIRGLCQKKMELILLPVLATVVMWRGKKSVVRVAQCVAALIQWVLFLCLQSWCGGAGQIQASSCSFQYHSRSIANPTVRCWAGIVSHISVC